jgi:large subunit ribosomal protein L24
MRFRKGEKVLVISGNDKGQTGEVLAVLPKADKVLVQGVNLRWEHKKATQQNPKGERIRSERPIHASNVMPIDPATGKGTRKPTR